MIAQLRGHYLPLLKRGFRRLSLREKGLVMIFVWTILLMVAIGGGTYLKKTLAHSNQISTQAKEQNFWLSNADLIQKKLDLALQRIDSNKAFSRDRLVGRVDTLARTLEKFNYDLDAPRTQDNGILWVHTVRVSLSEVLLPDLIAFKEAVLKESPYLSLESMAIIPDRGDPQKLRAQCTISSLELKQQKL